MDIPNAYSSWFQTHFPEVKIVLGPFHAINSVNEKPDDAPCRQFKGLRFLSLPPEFSPSADPV